MGQFFLSFPEFNSYSIPLLILVLQGLVLIALLFSRYIRKKTIPDLILGMILVLVCYRQVCYTVGFMGWYDSFRTTKINYALVNLTLAIAPLIYFYVKSVTSATFVFRRKYWLHFLPAALLVLYRLVIFLYDASQPGFGDTQNGYLKLHLDQPVVQPIMVFIDFAQMLLYLAFTFQLFYHYRKRIIQSFSNVYKLELNWILSFLVVFTLLFLYDALQSVIATLVTDLSYIQQYWLNIFMALVTLYVGVKGYFTDVTKLAKLDNSFTPRVRVKSNAETDPQIDVKELDRLRSFMNAKKPYLDPDLTLSLLAQNTQMTRARLSQLINSGFQKNFNDFVNTFRVNAVKTSLQKGEHKQLSLLGIAYDCGFSSKATFNRVFKKLTKQSPSEYVKMLDEKDVSDTI